MTFPRHANAQLARWYASPRRKPLILRGARQVGKSTAVQTLAGEVPLLLELNLERYEDLSLIRSCRSAAELVQRLEQHHNVTTLPPGTLIFLDEIQEHPEALSWLRFFYEDRPDLAVVAAGSLLEVRLRTHAMPMPVGRVEHLRIEPLSFGEFLVATGDDRIATDLTEAADRSNGIPEGLHTLAMERLRSFLLVGGLPEAVGVWRSTKNLVEVAHVHRSLDQTYREDLLKYGRSNRITHLQHVLERAPAHYGARFKMRTLAGEDKTRPVSEALSLLEQAMVLYSVSPTSSTAIPLVPRPKAAKKLLPLDIGLALSQLDIRAEQLAGPNVESLLGGRVAEAFVGIQLLNRHVRESRALSYWIREKGRQSTAEVDYLIPTPSGLMPIEVKSGATGRIRSLFSYLTASGGHEAVRLFASSGGTEQVTMPNGSGQRIRCTLRSMPLYMVEWLW